MKIWYWIVAAAVTAAGAGMMIEGAKDMRKEAAAAAEIKKAEQFADVQDISVKLLHADLTVRADADCKETTVLLQGMPDSVSVQCSDDGELRIEDKSKEQIQFFTLDWMIPRGTIEITVPEDTLKKLYTSVGSSEAEFHGISADEIILSNGSGSVILDHVTATEMLSVDSGSGAFYVADTVSDGEVYMDIGSGSMETKDCAFGSLETELGSGRLQAENVKIAGSMTSSIGSGSIEAEDLNVGGAATFQGGSGNTTLDRFTCGSGVFEYGSGYVDLTLIGKESDYALEYKNADEGEVTHTNGRKPIKIETSGNVDVTFTE